jgi:hypothetical protein
LNISQKHVLPERRTSGFIGMFPRMRIIPADLRFYILYPADVLLLPRQFAQPGATSDIPAGLRVHPNVINAWKNFFDPFKDIVPPILYPQGNIRLCSTGLVGTEIKAAMPTLHTGKTFWWHTTSREIKKAAQSDLR